MKFDNFCYWLQGHFEIRDHFSQNSLNVLVKEKNPEHLFLTALQVKCIRDHIKLHLECSLRNDISPEPFICWLDGILTHHSELSDEIQRDVVVEIRDRLNNLFIHKIDPQLPGDKDSLQDIHDGKVSDGKGKKKQLFKRPEGRGKALERRARDRDRRLMC